MGIREEIRLVKRGDGVRPDVLQRWRVEMDALCAQYERTIVDLQERLRETELDLDRATRPRGSR